MATFAETLAAISTKIFLRTEAAVPWANVQTFLQIMQTGNINARRAGNIEQMTKTAKTVGTSEAWKWPVDMTPLQNGGSYARGGLFTFANEDTMVSGSATAALYQQPVEVPISDIDVFASASDNEVAIPFLVNKLRNAKIKLGQLIADDLTDTATGLNNITTIAELIDSTGTACGIAQGTHANWASNETDLAGERLTIRTLQKKIRDMRRSKFAKIDLVLCGSGAGQFLLDEAEGLNYPIYDVVEVFGRNPSTNEPNLYLEVSHDVIKVSGAPVIIDESLDANDPGTVYGITLADLALYAANKANFTVEGWEKVNLSAGKDAQRAQLKWDGFFALFNRATHFKFTSVKNS